MSGTNTEPSPPAAAIAAINLRLDAVEKMVRDLLDIVSGMRDPTKMLEATTKRLDAVEAATTRQAASLAGVKSVADAAARTAADRPTRAELEAVRDGVIDGVGVFLNDRQKDSRASFASVAAEIAAAKAGSPSAQAASVIRAHLRQWAS